MPISAVLSTVLPATFGATVVTVLTPSATENGTL
jgi:hypothetical protein